MVPIVPTLYEWIGGEEALSRLIERFYQKVPADPILAPVFAHMSPDHFQHVDHFIGEVPRRSSAVLPSTPGSTAAMLR
jgi:hemoglobin